jgi:hypothetical protein
MWYWKQIWSSILSVLLSWLLFAGLIHYRGKQSWGDAIGKAFLLALQTGISLGFILFCCLDVSGSPVHRRFGLSATKS